MLRITSLALGQSHICLHANEATLLAIYRTYCITYHVLDGSSTDDLLQGDDGQLSLLLLLVKIQSTTEWLSTHCPLGNLNVIFVMWFSTYFDDWGISYEIALRWLSLDLTDEKSTLVQLMAWCRQASSHYLSQCWPSSMLPYGITRPQWINSLLTSPCR